MATIQKFWADLSLLQAILLGVGLGIVTGILPHAWFGWELLMPGFWLLFPFLGWFTILMARVLFSLHEREKILGKGFSFFGAFFAYLLRKYSLFCIAWHYTMSFYGISIDGL